VTDIVTFRDRLNTIKRSYASAITLDTYQSLDLGLKILFAESLEHIATKLDEIETDLENISERPS
jgi:hypothetical protein